MISIRKAMNQLFRKTTLHLLILILISYFPGCASNPGLDPFPAGPRAPLSIVADPPFSMPKNIYHEVGPGETLWRIGKSYDVDVNTILKANNLRDASQIKNGQRLLIPNTRGPRSLVPLYPTRRWTHIVIHHTATEVGNARSIDKMHHDRGFWNGLGYHFLIDNGTYGKLDGQIEIGPRWAKQKVGAHANANMMNERGIGIALVGNFSEDRVSPKQLEALVFVVQTLQEYYNIPDNHVIRHKDVPGKNTECPGNYFPWSDFKRRVAR